MVIVLILLAVLALPAPGAGPEIAGCAVFPASNVWNVPVDTLLADQNSQAYVNEIGASVSLHPDFGAGLYQGAPIGIPFVVVPGTQARVTVQFEYAGESDPGPYPVPRDAPIEGGPQSKGDRHILIVDRDSCRLWELFAAYPLSDGGWRAGSGAVFDLKSNSLRPDGWTSSDAAGFPVLPGLVRYEEVEAGEIRHAIRLTVPRTRRAYVWPARHQASSRTGTQYPPMGQRFRLREDFDVTGYSRQAQVILRALKQYGMLLADNGSAWFISGAPDDRWNNDQLRELRRVRGSDLEAVDTASLMLDRNSGQVRAQAWNPSMVNAASYRPGSIAPGEIVTVFEAGLGPDPGTVSRFGDNGLLPTVLGGARLLFDGTPAALLYAGSAQVSAVAPFALAGRQTAQISAEWNGGTRWRADLAVTDTAPGIFTADASGGGQGAILNEDYSPNSARNPARKGSTVMIYATGGGLTEPSFADGSVALVAARAVQPVAVRIGGAAAEVRYAGSAPSLVAGVMQVNARVPVEATTGSSVPVLLTVAGVHSQPDVTMAVQ